MPKFNEDFNSHVKILIPCCMPYEELDNRLLIIFEEQETLATSSPGQNPLQKQTSTPGRQGSMDSRHPLAGLTPSRGCKILLFLNNAPGYGHHSFSNIKLEFLPPNTTSKLQPLHAGIIAQVKALYRKRMLCNISFNIQQNITASEANKKIDIYTAIEWLSLAWSGVSNLNIQCCFNKVGFSQLHIDPPSDNTPDPDLESDGTAEMRQLIDVPFREFINLEHDKIIHPVVAEPGTLQADADVVPDDYQPDEVLDPTPQYKTTIAEDITKLAQIKKKSSQVG